MKDLSSREKNDSPRAIHLHPLVWDMLFHSAPGLSDTKMHAVPQWPGVEPIRRPDGKFWGGAQRQPNWASSYANTKTDCEVRLPRSSRLIRVHLHSCLLFRGWDKLGHSD